jgi:hypothetical protein
MTWDGHEVYGHDGGTIGQSAFLRIVPDAGVAVCLLTNGGHTQDLFRDLFHEVLGELAGIGLPPRPEPAATATGVDVSRHAGRYARESIELVIEERDGRLGLTMHASGPLASALGEHDDPTMELHPVTDDVFVGRAPGDETWTPVVFFRLEDGSPYVHMGARATPKVS